MGGLHSLFDLPFDNLLYILTQFNFIKMVNETHDPILNALLYEAGSAQASRQEGTLFNNIQLQDVTVPSHKTTDDLTHMTQFKQNDVDEQSNYMSVEAVKNTMEVLRPYGPMLNMGHNCKVSYEDLKHSNATPHDVVSKSLLQIQENRSSIQFRAEARRIG